MYAVQNIRNIAIIAHVDHGKTTLVNQLLRSSGTFRSNENVVDRAMDHLTLERERGITILAKTTAIAYRDHLINILDTPGHADFGGEVERIMRMVDGCLLLVDAHEGVMPQTRFVLKKALAAKLKPIVVINKIDRPHTNPKAVIDQILSLFMELGAPNEFLDFPLVYTSALQGTSSYQADLTTQEVGMAKVLDLIIREVPAPRVDTEGFFKWQATLLDFNPFVGRLGIGVIKRGLVHVNDYVTALTAQGSKSFRILKLFGYHGLHREEITEAHAGEIIAIAGYPNLKVGDTICHPQCLEAEAPITIDEPTLQMTFAVNSSPLVGQDGTSVTARVIEERLNQEAEKDVALTVKRLPNQEAWLVSGRGELHLGILIEQMRRDGFELEVSKPQPIIREENGQKTEPFEDVLVEVPITFQGPVMEQFGRRNAILINLDEQENLTRLHYVMASRALLGFMASFLTLTHGQGLLTHSFKEYRPWSNWALPARSFGVLVATQAGLATPYAIKKIEEHGTMFIQPGTKCYEGMIIGEHRYNNDLAVNATLNKHQTNVRSATKEMTIVLKAPRLMSLEDCLAYLNDDELVEITPTAYRLRKKILATNQRLKAKNH